MTEDTPKVNPGRATIKDVAKAAGVSAMSVSNVLNGHFQCVSAATRKRVELEIARLGYRRQANARSLRVAEQRSIGMVIVDESPFFLADHFTCQVVAGLANVLNQADYTLTVQGMRSEQLPSSMIMRNFEVGGFCAMISGPAEDRHRVVDSLAALGQPLIVFQEEFPARPDVFVMRQDDHGGGLLLADHLLARRVKTYLVITPRQGWPAIENRVAGLRMGLATDPEVQIAMIEAASESFADVQFAVAKYLKNNPLPGAVVGTNDSIAAAAMLLLLERGYRVPEEVRVVGFNGFEAFRLSTPRLTTVLSVPYEMGDRAARAMLRRLETGSFDTAESVLPVAFSANMTT